VRFSATISGLDAICRHEERRRSVGNVHELLGWPGGILIVCSAAAMSAALIVAFRPLLVRYALARPNARSSHTEPTPQGGGAAVIATTIVVGIAVALAAGAFFAPSNLGIVLTVAVMMAIVGAADDIRAIAVVPRLALQAAGVAIVVAFLPESIRIVPDLPWWVERALLVIGGLWFVNLVNFMDGLDWMTVAEVVPVTAGLMLIGAAGALPAQGIILALALLGATLGFAPFNRPVARLFLGDVGSLPVGLLLGWLLLMLAANGHLAAAILLPLYYLADATVTLFRRLARREPFWQAHRTHFYQRATDNGFTVLEIVSRVFAVNLALIALATATVILPTRFATLVALTLGILLVTWLLATFSRRRA
jgi:UDP-N-acetylmuramyl pentapeptide phosphotransferase/UDP-N-acetylglucosamine-1-phosphate transferase